MPSPVHPSPVPIVQGLVSAPAADTLSAPPADWNPPPKVKAAKGKRKGTARRRSAMSAQKRAVTSAADEVAASAEFVSTFGAGAPKQTDFANALALAGLWSTDVAQVLRWVEWARHNEAEVWAHAFVMLDQFQPVFEVAVARDANIGATYPSLVRYYNAGHQRGKGAATTRKAKANAALKAAHATTAGTPAATPVAAPPAAPAPASTPHAGGAAPSGT